MQAQPRHRRVDLTVREAHPDRAVCVYAGSLLICCIVTLSPSAVRVMAAVQRRIQQKATSRAADAEAPSDPAHAAAPTPFKSNPPELYSPGRSPPEIYSPGRSPSALHRSSTAPLPPRLPSTRRSSPHTGAMPRDPAADAEWSHACAGQARALCICAALHTRAEVLLRWCDDNAHSLSLFVQVFPPPPSSLLDRVCSECLVIRTGRFR
jgi:hypothetical protein